MPKCGKVEMRVQQNNTWLSHILFLQPRPLEREDSHLDSHFDMSKWGAILKQHSGAVSPSLNDLAFPLKQPTPKLTTPSSGPQSYAQVCI